MNKVVIIGRLVADVELNNYGKGKNGGVTVKTKRVNRRRYLYHVAHSTVLLKF